MMPERLMPSEYGNAAIRGSKRELQVEGRKTYAISRIADL